MRLLRREADRHVPRLRRGGRWPGSLALSRKQRTCPSAYMTPVGDIIYRQGGSVRSHIQCDFRLGGFAPGHGRTGVGRISQFLFSGAVFGLKPKGVAFSHGATAITTASICAIFPTARKLTTFAGTVRPSTNISSGCWSARNHLAVEALTSILGQGASLERVARILWSLASSFPQPSTPVSGRDADQGSPYPAAASLKPPG